MDRKRGEIRDKRVRKQKTDRQDAHLILRLLLEDRFPKIRVPSWENRDLRQLLWAPAPHGAARTRIMNQLQAWRSTKDCDARSDRGERLAESNSSRVRYPRGPVDAPLRGPGVFKPRDLSRRNVLKPLPRITVNPPCQTGHN